jgi:hypothetical protein
MAVEKAKVANKRTAESIVETTPAWLRKREAIEREFPNLNRTQITRILAIVFDDFQRQIDEIRARRKQKPAPSYRRILVTDWVRRQRFELAI